MAKLETKPVHGSFVHEVLGLDLWRPLEPDTIAKLRDIWAKSGVLLFRRQALSEQDVHT